MSAGTLCGIAHNAQMQALDLAPAETSLVWKIGLHRKGQDLWLSLWNFPPVHTEGSAVRRCRHRSSSSSSSESSSCSRSSSNTSSSSRTSSSNSKTAAVVVVVVVV